MRWGKRSWGSFSKLKNSRNYKSSSTKRSDRFIEFITLLLWSGTNLKHNSEENQLKAGMQFYYTDRNKRVNIHEQQQNYNGKERRNNAQVCKLIILIEMRKLTYMTSSKNTMGKGRRKNTQLYILNSILYKTKIIIMKVLVMCMNIPWEI